MTSDGEDHLAIGRAEADLSRITGGRLVRAMWQLALPMTATALLQNLFSIVDMIFVGRLGPHAIAAVAVSGTLLGILYMLAVGVLVGCTTLVAQAIGAGDRRRAEVAAAQSLVMAIGLSLAVAGAIPWAGDFLEVLGARGPVVQAGTGYLQISIGGAFTMLLSATFASALRGAGDAMTPLKVLGIGNLINILLDPLLIFGHLGFPALGVAGSAWATVFAQAVAAALMGRVFFVAGHRHFHLHVRDLAPRGRMLWRLFSVGVFSSGQMLTRNISAIVLVRIVAIFGTAALAAYGVGMRMFFAVLVPGIGLGNAAATLVGQNLGADQPKRAEHAAWLVTGVFAGVTVLIGLAFAGFARPLIAVFNDQPAVVANGATFLRWLAATMPFLALSVILGRSMNGAGDTFWPMLITGSTLFVFRIPLAYALARLWGSVAGVWVGMAASTVAQGALFALAFWWGRWKLIGRRQVQAAARAMEQEM